MKTKLWNLFAYFRQGKFSEMDSASWTPELQRALNYDRKSALQIDNGKTPEWFVAFFIIRIWTVRFVGCPVA